MRHLEGRRVLIVDDDLAQREVVTEILELEGVRVSEAASADEAGPLLDEKPDVVLLDLHGVDAEALASDVRRRPDRPALLVLSGDMRLKTHAERLGADGWLGKPYDLDDLIAAVSAAMEHRSGASGAKPA